MQVYNQLQVQTMLKFNQLSIFAQTSNLLTLRLTISVWNRGNTITSAPLPLMQVSDICPQHLEHVPPLRLGGVLTCGSDAGGSDSGWIDGGSNVYLITSSDNVGIGTTAPGEA
ncbi:hypothetical protein IPH70_00520 [Candidatus Roizmanbacteria bacterium]|nr:MAG: hypothetical protein IPH70_00520 [Candidatus Roizmanbacteria bacterium]